MKEDLTPWEILGINEGSSADEIRSAFRGKAKKLHPDYGGDAEEFMQLESAAEQLLSNHNVLLDITKPGVEIKIEGESFFVETSKEDDEKISLRVSKINPRQIGKQRWNISPKKDVLKHITFSKLIGRIHHKDFL